MMENLSSLFRYLAMICSLGKCQIRFEYHIFLKISKVLIKSSSAGEFHPHALTEPHVNLPIHRALIVQPAPKQSASGQTGPAGGALCDLTTATPSENCLLGACTFDVPTLTVTNQSARGRDKSPTCKSCHSN